MAKARSTSTPSSVRPRPALHADRGAGAGQVPGHRQVRRDASSWPSRLGVDPRKADQMVRGTVALPSGTGKDVRVAVFAAGDAAQEARDAGADIVGADDLAAEIEKGNIDFDVAIATPDMMPLVGRLGRVLGPAWPDAQPQDRHRHHRRRPRPSRSSRAARSSTAPTATATCTCRSARSASSRSSAGGELPRRARRAAAGQAGRRQGPLPARRSRSRRRWAPASRSTPTRSPGVGYRDARRRQPGPRSPPLAVPTQPNPARRRPPVPSPRGLMRSPHRPSRARTRRDLLARRRVRSSRCSRRSLDSRVAARGGVDGEPETREGRRGRPRSASKLDAADAALLTEYRGLNVEAAGRRCAASCARPAASTRSTRTPWCASPPASWASTSSTTLLTGPTAITFVSGDAAARGQGAARLRPHQPALVVKGGAAGRQGR